MERVNVPSDPSYCWDGDLLATVDVCLSLWLALHQQGSLLPGGLCVAVLSEITAVTKNGRGDPSLEL